MSNAHRVEGFLGLKISDRETVEFLGSIIPISKAIVKYELASHFAEEPAPRQGYDLLISKMPEQESGLKLMP